MRTRSLFLSIALFLASISCFAQKLDGFKYVSVQTLQYTDGSVDRWGISQKVRDAFVKKGFTLLTDDIWNKIQNTEYVQSVLKITITHTSVVEGVNKVTLNLSDIDGNLVMTMTGGGMGLSLQGDYNMATNNALATLKTMRYKFDPEKMPKEILPPVEKVDWDEEKLREYYDNSPVQIAEIEGIYKTIPDDNTGEMRLGIFKDGYKFKAVILETSDYRWAPGEVKAVFEPASRTYSVSWYMGNKSKVETFGGISNEGYLEVDLTSRDSGKVKLIKIYPISEESNTTGTSLGRWFE